MPASSTERPGSRLNLRKESDQPDQWLDQNYFSYWYPLMEWGLDREKCKQIIANAGLPVPVKSACWFCPRAENRKSSGSVSITQNYVAHHLKIAGFSELA